MAKLFLSGFWADLSLIFTFWTSKEWTWSAVWMRLPAVVLPKLMDSNLSTLAGSCLVWQFQVFDGRLKLWDGKV